MHHIQNAQEDFIVYRKFLKGLILHTQNVTINWNNSSFIEDLSCTNYLPDSFKNDGIYELSLLIARAIYEENDELLPYDAEEGNWRELTKDLKESSRSALIQKVPFILRWRVIKKDDNLQLSYYVEFAKKISMTYIDEHHLNECSSFSLYVQSQYISTYIRTANDSFICRESKFVNFTWKEEPVILLQLKQNNHEILDITAPNSFAPDFENPQLLVEADGYWNFKSGVSNLERNVIIYPKDWKCSNIYGEGQDVQLVSKKLTWLEFSDSITLKNQDTLEEITFDNISTAYTCEFAGWSINWVQNANYKILSSEPNIRLYDELMERVRTGNIEYREYRGTLWIKYQRGSLPIGLLEFRIELPDNKFIKERFYYTGNLVCCQDDMAQNTGKIIWQWKFGSVSPVPSQPGLQIEEIGTNLWQITRKNNLDCYPDTTRFNLIPTPNLTKSPYLEIAVASPFKGVVLLNSVGEEIANNQVICRTSLYGYRYIVMGKNVPTKVFHLQNDSAIILGVLSQGIYSLSRFEDSIREMFLLNGSDPFDYDSKVRVIIGQGGNNKLIEVKEYNVYSTENESKKAIVIIDNPENKNVIDYQGQLFGLAVDCKNEDIIVEELEKKEDGFCLKEESRLKKFILFSDRITNNHFADQVVPRYYNFSDEPVEREKPEDNELSPQELNIRNIKELLDNSPAFEANLQQAEEWSKVIQYYNLVIKYSLPFKTLNCFRAIARSPLLMAKMTYLLWQNLIVNKDNLQQGISRFENEFAVAWHWINSDDWNSAMEWLLVEIPELLIPTLTKGTFENCKSLLDYTLNSETGELLNILFNNAPQTKEVIHPLTPCQIQQIQGKLGDNKNLPTCFIPVNKVWENLFPLNHNLPNHVKSLLLSPVKVALTMTGKEDSLWNESNSKIRRTINFYRQFLPIDYVEILLLMVKLIHQKNKN